MDECGCAEARDEGQAVLKPPGFAEDFVVSPRENPLFLGGIWGI